MFMWTEEQKNTINKRNSNVLVSASAGSGKTTVLISRVIKKVIEEEIDIDKILVVTFTNAAAQKLKEDLLVKLKKEYIDNISKRVFIKRQMKLLNRANISTIHSFCLNLIKTNFEIIGVDPDIKVCDDAKINIYKSKALNEVIEEEYKSENKMLFLLLELFKHKEEKMCVELINIYDYIQSFEKPFFWLKENIEKYNKVDEVKDLYNTDFGQSIYKDVTDELKLLSAKIEKNIKQLELYDDFSQIKDTLAEYKAQIDDIRLNSNNSWDKLYDKLQALKFKSLPSYKGTMIEKKEEIADFKKNVLTKSISKLQKNIYGNSQKVLQDNKSVYKYLVYVYEILCKFEKKYAEIKASKNVIDYSDIEHFAYKILVNDDKKTDIASKLSEKFYEVYTDEYQDTSKIQEAILNVVSKENNRFMVGDIKQSIYGFRQASPQIFNDKLLKYQNYNGNDNDKNDTKIILAKNFRSRPEVIDFVNLIFEKIMSMKAGNSEYSGDEVLKCGREETKKEDFYKTKVKIIDLNKEKNKNKFSDEDSEKDESLELIEELKDFEIESKIIAHDIKELVQNTNDKTINYKDIVILLRNTANKAQILESALKDENIPVFSDVSNSIFDSEEIKLILSFLRIIDNKYQDIYLTSIMYSIIGKFTIDELINIRSIDGKCDLYTCLLKFIENENSVDLTLKNKVEKFLEIISSYQKYAKNLTISELLIKLFNETGIYYEFILDENYKQRKANLDLLLDLTLQYEKENGSFLNEYIEYVDNLSNKRDSSITQAKIIGENENVVRIMTIHKSKGLEFPVVILADSAKVYNKMEFKNKMYLHQTMGVGINIIDDEYKISYPSLIKSAIKNNLENENKSEELRLLYVALTRARDKLIIYGTKKNYLKSKSSMFIMMDKEKIDAYTVLKNDNYLDNILIALEIANEKEKDIYDLEIVRLEENIDILNSTKEDVDFLEDIKQNRKNISKEQIEEELNVIKNNMLDNILKEQENDIMQRVSVTRLKKGEENILKIPDKVIPNCLDEENIKVSSARKGTLVHFILQILDFNKIKSSSDLEAFLNQSVENNVISKDEKKYINVSSIMKFLDSDIGKEIKSSKLVEREKEFTLRNNSFTKSTIQGVIDLYYETSDGKIILLDFKTDNLAKESDFIELYKKQLDIYQEAIEKLEKKKVDKKYIYSFKLGKKIEVI